MQNIVVPTDFSFISYNALDFAKKIAKKTDGTIYLIHVMEPIVGRYSSIGEFREDDLDDVYNAKLTEKIGNELKALKQAHANRFYEIQTKVLIGDPFKEIKDFITFIDPDLVIMGAKGYTDAAEFFLGSLTDKVVRSISCPVISVKGKVEENEFKNIVYATDLEEENVHILNTLKELQSLFDSKLHIVKINTHKNFRNDIDTMVELRFLADKYQLKNFTLNCYSHEDEEYGVIYFADDRQADLIAMGIHEKSGFRRLISGGSLLDEVTDHTFRPILTHRFQSEKE